MASRSFHDLFLRARDQFVGSSRWTFLAVLTLALFHLVVVTPFIDSRHAESETSLALERLDAIENGLSELRSALQAIFAETESVMAPALNHLAEDLELDLGRLEATRKKIAADALAQDSARDTSDPTAAQPPSQDPPLDPRLQPFLLDNPDWVADLRDARSRDEMLAALTPIVDQLITQPRYFDATRAWRDEARPRLQARLDAAASLVPRLRGRFPEAKEPWEALVGTLSEFSRSVQELDFAPPEQPFWWTVPTTSGELALGLTPTIHAEIRQPRVLAELQKATARTGERYEDVNTRVAQAREALGETPDTGRLAVFELAAVLPMFPLLRGLILGSAVIWRSQRLRELGVSIRLAIEHGGPEALQRWLWSQVQWSSGVRSISAAWHRCVIQTLLGYFLAMAWIALAAMQLRQLPTLDRQRLMAVTFAGATIVLGAVVHRLLVARRAIEPPNLESADIDGEVATDADIAQPSEGGRDARAPSKSKEPIFGTEPDSELIDAQTLRR